ncbi:putative F-box/FBD/LRR-repeat protein [Senna tora]|uniref:Putative F-box/FBD/LRR-repeat protein n=1 Tax=Senna tora TaxID=362788 RepID=A0A834T1J9_9FABA|nr:putative F-box/FBD/LRR-repeat protein [Senna tora]
MIVKAKRADSANRRDARMQRAELQGSCPILKRSRRTILTSRNVGNSEATESQDALANLPDCLVHHILSFMETKDAMRTSVLSKRWRYIWTSTPCLNLNSKSFSKLADFRKFVIWVLSHRDSSHIKSLTYCRFGVDYATDQYLLNKVIDYATSHGVEEIRINLRGKSSGCKSLEMCHLEHFPLLPYGTDSSNPFTSIGELFGFTTLTTLHLNRFTLSCTGIARLDPFAKCVNLKNLHLSEICFKSDLTPRDFVISAPKLNNLALLCNRFKCKLVIAAPELINFDYLHSSASAFFEYSLPSLHDLVIDIHEQHDQLEVSHQRQREATLHGLINMSRGHHKAEAVKLSFSTIEATCGAAALLKCESSSFSKPKLLNLEEESTYKIFISNFDHIIAYFRNFSQLTDFDFMTV